MAKPKFQVQKQPEKETVLGNGFEKNYLKAAQRAQTCVREKCTGNITIVPAKDNKGTKGYYWEVVG